jgi:hypothetical protein
VLVGLCSLKSSPGVTTTALTLAGAWPSGGARPTVLELDVRGGDVAWRFGLAADPGLQSLAVAARVRPMPELLAAHAQPVGAAEVRVVAAPVERDAARHAAASLKALLDVLGNVPEPVLVDLGEVDLKDADARSVLAGAAALLVVARAVPEQVARLQAATRDLLSVQPQVKAVLVGDIEYREAAGMLALPVAGVLPLINPDASPLAGLLGLRSRRSFEVAAMRLATEVSSGIEPSGSMRKSVNDHVEVSL